MSSVFTIAPRNGWQPGDRVVCVRGTRATSPTLEVGKTYIVESARSFRGMVQWSLTLKGVSLPPGYEGISSGRFVKLRLGERPLAEIERHITPVWIDAYRASVGQSPHPDDK